jgi:hypothetical protein
VNPAATLAAYTAALALVFGAAVGVGNAVGPVGTAADVHGSTGNSVDGDSDRGTSPQVGGLSARGLAASQDGYTLQLARNVQTPGEPGLLEFAIAGPHGERVTEFTPAHDKELHLIVVRRDLTAFQHVHPERDAQGRWSVPLELADPGPYKVFADFIPAGRTLPLTLAADFTAPGAYTPKSPGPPSRTASVDGYEVSLAGDLVAGTSSKLTLTVTKDGRPVTDLQPYLAAYGHLVAIRDGDLAYLHVHPDGGVADPATTSGPEITFYVDVPTAAPYGLFLDFQHADAVRTAAFTRAAAVADAPAGETISDSGADHGSDGH